MVFMLKPSVGLMVVVSSPLMRFTMVVLPALSSPLRVTGTHTLLEKKMPGYTCQAEQQASPACRTSAQDVVLHVAKGAYTIRKRISFSFCFTFLMMVSSPMSAQYAAPKKTEAFALTCGCQVVWLRPSALGYRQVCTTLL